MNSVTQPQNTQLSKDDIQALREHYSDLISDLGSNREHFLKTAIGTLNFLVYILMTSKSLEISNRASVKGLQTYLGDYWTGAYKSRTSIYTVLNWLEKSGVLMREHRDWSSAANRNRIPASMLEFDVEKSLLMAEAIEKHLTINYQSSVFHMIAKKSRYPKKEIPRYPRHGGAFLIICFNAVFLSRAVWRRRGSDYSNYPVFKKTESQINKIHLRFVNLCSKRERSS